MILDSSALVAIILREPGFEALLTKIGSATVVGVGAPTLVETSLVLGARLERDARPLISALADEHAVAVIPFTRAHYKAAATAWLRFGKGRHPAALNFGDCLAYAAAAVAGEPLLCLGDDFPRTDLQLA